MQIDATANGISRRCTLMRSYHSQLKLRDQIIYFISISWGQNILPHFPFRHRKGREAFKPRATDDESRGNASGGWGVGRKSPPHCKAKEAETLAGFNLGARHPVNWATPAILTPRPSAKVPCSTGRFHQGQPRRGCAGGVFHRSCGGCNPSNHPGSNFPARG